MTKEDDLDIGGDLDDDDEVEEDWGVEAEWTGEEPAEGETDVKDESSAYLAFLDEEVQRRRFPSHRIFVLTISTGAKVQQFDRRRRR